MTVEEMFERVTARLFAEDRELERGRALGATGIRTGGKVFAMNVKGELVVKLPAGRVNELLACGAGRRFDPGHGRVLKEWVALRPADEAACDRHLRDARAFVRAHASR